MTQAALTTGSNSETEGVMQSKSSYLQLKVLDFADQVFDRRLCFAFELCLLVLWQLLNHLCQPRLQQATSLCEPKPLPKKALKECAQFTTLM